MVKNPFASAVGATTFENTFSTPFSKKEDLNALSPVFDGERDKPKNFEKSKTSAVSDTTIKGTEDTLIRSGSESDIFKNTSFESNFEKFADKKASPEGVVNNSHLALLDDEEENTNSVVKSAISDAENTTSEIEIFDGVADNIPEDSFLELHIDNFDVNINTDGSDIVFADEPSTSSLFEDKGFDEEDLVEQNQGNVKEHADLDDFFNDLCSELEEEANIADTDESSEGSEDAVFDDMFEETEEQEEDSMFDDAFEETESTDDIFDDLFEETEEESVEDANDMYDDIFEDTEEYVEDESEDTPEEDDIISQESEDDYSDVFEEDESEDTNSNEMVESQTETVDDSESFFDDEEEADSDNLAESTETEAIESDDTESFFDDEEEEEEDNYFDSEDEDEDYFGTEDEEEEDYFGAEDEEESDVEESKSDEDDNFFDMTPEEDEVITEQSATVIEPVKATVEQKPKVTNDILDSLVEESVVVVEKPKKAKALDIKIKRIGVLKIYSREELVSLGCLFED